MSSTRSQYLLEISQELTRFNIDWQGKFRCPTCLKDYPLDSKEITEEHIVPDSQGGRVTTFLCGPCNSFFGHKQTRWLSDWIDLVEGGAPFHRDPKKQKVSQRQVRFPQGAGKPYSVIIHVMGHAIHRTSLQS